MCGIYVGKSKSLGWLYVGGTTQSFKDRFSQHRRDMRRGTAPRKLQAVADLFGVDDIEFSPIKEFPAEEVSDREAEAIARLAPKLNSYGSADRPLTHQREAKASIGYLEHNGRCVTPAQLARETGLSAQVLVYRYRKGLRDEDLVKPPHKAKRKPYTRHN